MARRTGLGAQTQMILTGPSSVERPNFRILSVPSVGGSIICSSVFLTAKPTLFSLGSSALFACQKKV